MSCLPREQHHDRLMFTFKISEQEEVSASSVEGPSPPSFDVSRITAILCKIGLIFTWLTVVICLVVAAALMINPPGRPFLCLLSLSSTASEALSFTVNILVALLTDCLGFIHSTSLRWALYREDRLFFNTNLRLFTSARRSAPNRWPSNALCMASLILCYAATSQLFIKSQEVYASTQGSATIQYVLVNRMAIAALGLGLMGQAAVASWCLCSTLKEIPTWSSNPLNNTLAWLNFGNSGSVHGRCMMSVHQRNLPARKSRPQKRQSSPFNFCPAVRYILILIWSLVILAIVWAVTLLLVSRHSTDGVNPWYLSASWYIEAEYHNNDVTLVMNPRGNGDVYAEEISNAVQIFCAILFTCAIQGVQTIGLHCTELLVNLSRDEKAWRAATLPQDLSKSRSKPKGAQLKTSALKAAVSSWENALLFSLKALLHWLLGQSLLPSFQYVGYQFDMLYMRVFVYGIAAMFLALFATYLALQKPSGPQPAAYGHLQTLANLVDDWGTGTADCLWWGDKGLNADGTRHAGTSADLQSLGNIQMDAEYEGMRETKRE